MGEMQTIKLQTYERYIRVKLKWNETSLKHLQLYAVSIYIGQYYTRVHITHTLISI